MSCSSQTSPCHSSGPLPIFWFHLDTPCSVRSPWLIVPRPAKPSTTSTRPILSPVSPLSVVCPVTPHLIPSGLSRSSPPSLCPVRPVLPHPSCPLLSCFIPSSSFPSRSFPSRPMQRRHAPHHHPSLPSSVFRRPVWGHSHITSTFKGGRVVGFGNINLLTVGGEGGCTKVKMLTVVDGRRGGRVESKNFKVLLYKVDG